MGKALLVTSGVDMTSSSASQPAGEAEQGGEVDLRALCAPVCARFEGRVRAAIRGRLRSGADESLVSDILQTVFLKLFERVRREKALPPDVLWVLLDLAKNQVDIQRRSLARRRRDSEHVCSPVVTFLVR